MPNQSVLHDRGPGGHQNFLVLAQWAHVEPHVGGRNLWFAWEGRGGKLLAIACGIMEGNGDCTTLGKSHIRGASGLLRFGKIKEEEKKRKKKTSGGSTLVRSLHLQPAKKPGLTLQSLELPTVGRSGRMIRGLSEEMNCLGNCSPQTDRLSAFGAFRHVIHGKGT